MMKNLNETAIIPTNRITERKIGRTTFLVSTAFNNAEKERDIFNIISRLIQNDKSLIR